MPHPYSNALYYPTIDISNTEWLKTTVLFWDSISTIVPESLDNPYQENDTRFLSENGFLKPLRINSNDDDVIDIGNEIIEFNHDLLFAFTNRKGRIRITLVILKTHKQQAV